VQTATSETNEQFMTWNFATHQAYWSYIRWWHHVDVSCTVGVLKKNWYHHLQGTNVKELSGIVPVQVMPNFVSRNYMSWGWVALWSTNNKMFPPCTTIEASSTLKTSW